jgi:tetratricopeptide (TPR) repeat protein
MNDDDRGLIYYDRIISETPDSNYVPESFVRMGEIYFNRDQFEKAIERYMHVLEFKESLFYDKALYKLGWCYYKLVNFEQAVHYFTEVLKFYSNKMIAGSKKGDDLLQESIDYIAISFTETGGSDGAAMALAFINQFQNDEISRQVLWKVGEVYDESTDYSAARQAYKAYEEKFPLAPDIPIVLSKLAHTYERTRCSPRPPTCIRGSPKRTVPTAPGPRPTAIGRKCWIEPRRCTRWRSCKAPPSATNRRNETTSPRGIQGALQPGDRGVMWNT